MADPTTTLTQGGGAGGKPKPPAREEVTTIAQARDVAARRKANLEAKQLDKCPLCKQQHEYEKEWAKVVPVAKVKMVSTLLTSCPQFGAQPPDQKLVTIAAHAACPLCTSWEHTRHKFGGKELPEPKCKVLVAGAECGGGHGRWFHATIGNTGNLVSALPVTDAVPTPGLFEVYTAEFVAHDGSRVPGTIMVDSGSDTDYVRHGFAESLGLEGEPHVCRIKVVDMDYRTVNTAKYGLSVVDVDGEAHAVSAQGLGSITTLPPDPDLSPLLPLLGDVPPEVLARPQGPSGRATRTSKLEATRQGCPRVGQPPAAEESFWVWLGSARDSQATGVSRQVCASLLLHGATRRPELVGRSARRLPGVSRGDVPRACRRVSRARRAGDDSKACLRAVRGVR